MSYKTLADYPGLEALGIHVKFTKPEFLDGLLDGGLYMNNFNTFIELEKMTKKKGQGDKLEAGFVVRGDNAKIYYKGVEVGTANFAEVVERYEEAKKVPVFCFSGFESKDIRVVEENKDGLIIKVQVSSEDQQSFIDDFGSKAVVLPGDFLNRVHKATKEGGVSFVAGRVAYHDYNIHDSKRRKLFDEGSTDMFFWKDDFFNYQRECRIVIPDNLVEESTILNIGDLRDEAIVIDTKDFFDTFALTLKFKEN